MSIISNQNWMVGRPGTRTTQLYVAVRTYLSLLLLLLLLQLLVLLKVGKELLSLPLSSSLLFLNSFNCSRFKIT